MLPGSACTTFADLTLLIVGYSVQVNGYVGLLYVRLSGPFLLLELRGTI